MSKKELLIGIFTDKYISFKYEAVLKKNGYKNIKNCNIAGICKEKPDILIIDEKFLKEARCLQNNVFLIILITDFQKTIDINKTYKTFVKEYVLKSVSNDEIISFVNKLATFKLLEYKTASYAKEMEKLLIYKDAQENKALNKQLKIIKDNLSMKFYDDKIYSVYFRPKDIISGDSYLALKIKNKNLFIIVDSMGKGLSAGITSMLSVSFVSYLLEEFEYDFKTVIKKTISYIKNILLEEEILCIIFLEEDENKITYANFSMPPIYIKENKKIIKLKANNTPVYKHTLTDQINISTYESDFDSLTILSDGILEEKYKDSSLYTEFKRILLNHYFFNDIVKEIKRLTNNTFNDDVTVINITKDKFSYKKIFEKTYLLKYDNIDSILNEIENLNLKNKHKIDLILMELLLNTYEHQNEINKEKIIKNNETLSHNKKIYVKIIIYINELYTKLRIIQDKKRKFDVSEIFKKENLKKYSGRGIITVNFFTSATAYNEEGNETIIYLRRNNGIRNT